MERDPLAALTRLTDRAYGKPAQALDGQDAEPTEGKFTLEFVHAQCPKCGYSHQDEVQGEHVTAPGAHE